MGRLAGKVALVTGAAEGGTGFGVASALLREGAQVVVCDIDDAVMSQALRKLEQLGDVWGTQADVARRADVERTVAATIERFGRLDVLVNNAAVSTPGVPLHELDDAAIRLNLGAGLYGAIYFMQAAFPWLKERGGSVINFGSRNGIYGAAGFSLYAAAKEAIRGLSRSAAREWGPLNIRVNVLCPATLSPGARAYLEANPEEAHQALAGVALGYFGDGAADIGPVAVFLASDDSRYVTGQTINVDGGQVML